MNYAKQHFVVPAKAYPGGLVAGLETRRIGGALVPTPAEAETLLTAIYGDWRKIGSKKANEGLGCANGGRL